MKGAPQQDGMLGLNASEWNIVIMVAIFCAIIFAEKIIPGIYTIPWTFLKKAELNFILFFEPILSDSYVDGIRTILWKLDRIPLDSITLAGVSRVEAEERWIQTLFYSVPAFLVAFKIFRRPKFDQRLNLESLIEFQTKKAFRFNRHLTKINPLKEGLDVRVGPYRIRQRPVHFCTENNITDWIDPYDESKGKWFNRDIARQVLNERLKQDIVFTNFESLPDEVRQVIAGMMLFIFQGKDKAVNYFGDASYAYINEFPMKTHMRNTDSIINKYKNEECIREAVVRHKYVTGVLRRIFFTAQHSGTFSTALFTWFQINYRIFFLALDDAGIPEHSSEYGFSSVHLAREFEVGRRLDGCFSEQWLDALESELLHYNVIKMTHLQYMQKKNEEKK